jgi:uncharacterized protein YqgC (DUF456 family)
MPSEILWVFAVVLVAVGLAGIVLPALPGIPLLFVGLLLAAWAESFRTVGVGTIVLIGVLGLCSFGADFLASVVGVKRFGGSKRAVIGAALGGVAGLFFGLPGVLIGPFAGAVIGELSLRRDVRTAGRAGIGATLGFLVGTALKIGLALSMLGVFLVARFV